MIYLSVLLKTFNINFKEQIYLFIKVESFKKFGGEVIDKDGLAFKLFIIHFYNYYPF